MTKIAGFGTGQVGDVLANAFLALGDSVKRASRDPAKLDDWKAKAPGDASVASFVFRRVRVRGPCGRARQSHSAGEHARVGLDVRRRVAI